MFNARIQTVGYMKPTKGNELDNRAETYLYLANYGIFRYLNQVTGLKNLFSFSLFCKILEHRRFRPGLQSKSPPIFNRQQYKKQSLFELFLTDTWLITLKHLIVDIYVHTGEKIYSRPKLGSIFGSIISTFSTHSKYYFEILT